PPACQRLISATDRRTRSRSRVGTAPTLTSPEKVTRPTRSLSGARSRNLRAAVFAASSLVGRTSVESIDREVSTTSTTVAFSTGADLVTGGPAIATPRSGSAAVTSASGAYRRIPPTRDETPRRTSTFG